MGCKTSGRIFRTEGQQPDARATTSRGGRSFASGVTGTDDQDVMHGTRLSR